MKILGIVFVVLSSVFALGCVGEVDPSEPQTTEPEHTGEAVQAALPSCDSVDGLICHVEGQTRACQIGFIKQTCDCTQGFWSCP